MLFKTTQGAYPALSEAIERLHNYELPELLAVPVDSGSDSYLGWLAAVSTQEQV
jgi:periplasmic divalent cation tolerance protein